jgi:hypothetical protein
MGKYIEVLSMFDLQIEQIFKILEKESKKDEMIFECVFADKEYKLLDLRKLKESLTVVDIKNKIMVHDMISRCDNIFEIWNTKLAIKPIKELGKSYYYEWSETHYFHQIYEFSAFEIKKNKFEQYDGFYDEKADKRQKDRFFSMHEDFVCYNLRDLVVLCNKVQKVLIKYTTPLPVSNNNTNKKEMKKGISTEQSKDKTRFSYQIWDFQGHP